MEVRLYFITDKPQKELLYNWTFFPESARSHWLIRGHMTSNVETASRQKLSERVTLQNL